ncbi:MAG: hypothetical protein L3J65_08675 [Robiginitomaculum sp.]|nr:hypothetical protein [Robiginitomaculum sp.]
MSGDLSLKPSYYEALKRLTIELVGVKLGADHTFLVETRLSALARKEGFEDLPQMIDELFSRGQTRLAIHVVTSLLERATRFFEDRPGYEALGDIILPDLHPLYRGGTLRIMSYGCSSGQEIYSAAILVDTLADLFPNMDIELTGVDYPSEALDRARAGRFTHFEVQRGLPIRHLIKYFDRDGEDWVVKQSLREKITFLDHNLLADIGELGTFQVVMFRGHLGQFTTPAKARILRSLGNLVSANGYLMLGSHENLDDTNFWFKAQAAAPGCYKKRTKQGLIAEPETEPETGTEIEEFPKQPFVPMEYKGSKTV